MQPSIIRDALLAPDADPLFAEARALRDRVFGREVFQRGVVEFSNHCRKNCHYCGLRAANTELQRFRLDAEAILDAARTAVELGMGTVVLQSGEEETADIRSIGDLIGRIKRLGDISVTLSLGDHSEDAYRYWRDCGADRYLLKMETFNPELHARLRPGQNVAERLARVETLCRLGYETGSGIITGLPDMTPEILAEDLRLLSGLPLDMIAVGPFIPHPQTPLKDAAAGRIDEALRATALLRLMNPTANIPATSALDALDAHGREKGLNAGANVIMPSVTPEPVRAGYNIYPGKNAAPEPVRQIVGRLQQRLRDAGYEPSSSRGASPAKNARQAGNT
ncbi:[FeFe] hydrogenase H-cluster radical SAM maturase HydE [Desulfovibrio mangrovi]|uniref:[FeFe] hydrogenase H-cluster radical SAM maturase HydE n=1 Tax=Desulfovibrio mangrovi TaxID=2976983 RepID=UPI0022478B0A|nr:[FeFe] hydrogenase H-cluster radical SAM maturase HydE [Desulfovibrio mangrovi]UZP66973.1 [FeFe] hydrogenase H-cluster radical SAM maturase HydE [Desulfovibrio mangrovi]